MKKIAQIIPYFGRWPEWIELYLYSCSRNPMVDFILYTDCPTENFPEYGNVRFVKMTLPEYCRLVSERLGMDYAIKNTYKLTDLKPFLGAVHKPELEGYDFWSFGDLDLCYGNLSMVLNDKNLDRFDLITTHCYHIAGHLTVLRNNEYYRNLCFDVQDWQHRLTDDTHHGFDEGEWSGLVYPKLRIGRALWKYGFKYVPGLRFFSFMNCYNRIADRKQLFKEYYTSPAPKPGETWTYALNTNEVEAPDGRRLPYIHFLFFKKTPWFETERYWREGYYGIDGRIERYKTIQFSLAGIKGV